MTVFLKEFGMNVMREQLDLHSKGGPLTGSDVNTIIGGVTGQLEGQVIYTFEEKVAVRIASADRGDGRRAGRHGKERCSRAY